MYLGCMEDRGFTIDEGTGGSALNGCKNAAEPQVADYLLDSMSRVSVSANLIHLKLAIGALTASAVSQETHRSLALMNTS